MKQLSIDLKFEIWIANKLWNSLISMTKIPCQTAIGPFETQNFKSLYIMLFQKNTSTFLAHTL